MLFFKIFDMKSQIKIRFGKAKDSETNFYLLLFTDFSASNQNKNFSNI